MLPLASQSGGEGGGGREFSRWFEIFTRTSPVVGPSRLRVAFVVVIVIKSEVPAELFRDSAEEEKEKEEVGGRNSERWN